MTGTLRLQPSGSWAIAWPGREPVRIRAGESFKLEVDGQMRRTRMEYRDARWQEQGYYSADGYRLADGLRAGFFDQRERYARSITA
jgi:hypothetical protein